MKLLAAVVLVLSLTVFTYGSGVSAKENDAAARPLAEDQTAAADENENDEPIENDEDTEDDEDGGDEISEDDKDEGQDKASDPGWFTRRRYREKRLKYNNGARYHYGK